MSNAIRKNELFPNHCGNMTKTEVFSKPVKDEIAAPLFASEEALGQISEFPIPVDNSPPGPLDGWQLLNDGLEFRNKGPDTCETDASLPSTVCQAFGVAFFSAVRGLVTDRETLR